MSPRRPRIAVGQLLLACYPELWRARYGLEMLALIEDDPPGLHGLCSLLSGAARAHLGRGAAWRASGTPVVRMRLALSGLFTAWVAISVAGASFQKATEDRAFAAAGARHAALQAGREIVLAGALLGALAVAVGGLPLLWSALRGALAGDRRLAVLLALPLAGLGLFAAVTGGLLLLLPAAGSAHPRGAQIGLLLPWWGTGLLCALAIALAPRLVLARGSFSTTALRRATLLGPLLVLAMGLVSAGLLLYVAALTSDAPALAAQSGGPIGSSTALTLAAGAAVAAVCTVLAALGASRGLAAARAPAA